MASLQSSTDIVVLHLSLIDGVGPAAVRKILECKSEDFDWSDLYQYTTYDFVNKFGFSQIIAEKAVKGLQNFKPLETECALLDRHHDVTWYTVLDADYPVLLKEIYAAPTVLYCKGAPLIEQKTIAIVGARKADNYAQTFIERITPELVKREWVVVSGGAVGADAMAHRATVNAGGKTIVVFGSGLLQPYPSLNFQLFDDVLACGGTLVTSFPMNCAALSQHFPARNRVISGLSRGCIVVQAAFKSGARITAQYALEQGREVFALPGSIDNELSDGCHALIQEGAKLVRGADDILVEFGEVEATSKPVPANISDKQIAIPLTDQIVKPIAKITLKPLPKKVEVLYDVTTVQGKIMQACEPNSSMDDLLAKTGLNMLELNANLFDLQLEGKLAQNFAGKWDRV